MMATTLMTIILAFNIVLLILYFIVKVHKHTVDRARKKYHQQGETEEQEG